MNDRNSANPARANRASNESTFDATYPWILSSVISGLVNKPGALLRFHPTIRSVAGTHAPDNLLVIVRRNCEDNTYTEVTRPTRRICGYLAPRVS